MCSRYLSQSASTSSSSPSLPRSTIRRRRRGGDDRVILRARDALVEAHLDEDLGRNHVGDLAARVADRGHLGAASRADTLRRRHGVEYLDPLDVRRHCSASGMLALARALPVVSVLVLRGGAGGAVTGGSPGRGSASWRPTRSSVSERRRLRCRCASRLVSSALMAHMRPMSARIAVTSSVPPRWPSMGQPELLAHLCLLERIR